MRAMGFVCVLSCLAACGPAADAPPPESAPMQVEDTAFGDMSKAMDKARTVEDTTLQHKEDLDRRLEQEGG